MFKTIVALAFLAVAGMPSASQEPRPATPAPEQQQTPSKPPAMSEDKRVKTEGIDSVMADPNVVLLDVREPKEIDELGGYEGAINIPITQLEKRLGELPKDKTILTA